MQNLARSKPKRIMFFVSAAIILLGLLFYLGGLKLLLPAALLRDGNYLLDLVNKQNTLGSYVPDGLVSLGEFGASEEHLRPEAYNGLKALYKMG